MILYKQFNFGLASQTFGLVTSSNSLPEGQPHLFIFVSPCRLLPTFPVGHLPTSKLIDSTDNSVKQDNVE